MEFVILFSSQGRYLSRNLHQVIKNIIARAIDSLASTGTDPYRYISSFFLLTSSSLYPFMMSYIKKPFPFVWAVLCRRTIGSLKLLKLRSKCSPEKPTSVMLIGKPPAPRLRFLQNQYLLFILMEVTNYKNGFYFIVFITFTYYQVLKRITMWIDS